MNPKDIVLKYKEAFLGWTVLNSTMKLAEVSVGPRGNKVQQGFKVTELDSPNTVLFPISLFSCRAASSPGSVPVSGAQTQLKRTGFLRLLVMKDSPSITRVAVSFLPL